MGLMLLLENPPYNASGNIGTGHTIWQNFTYTALMDWLLPGGYLLYCWMEKPE